MKPSDKKSTLVMVISILLVATSCAISYKIIHTFCHLVSMTDGERVSLELLKDQMQALKDWGGIVLGFFFGAAFNFVTVAITSSEKGGSEVEAKTDDDSSKGSTEPDPVG